MSLAVSFSTISEMYLNLTDKYEATDRPLMRHKVDGVYQPISYKEARERVALLYHGLKSLGISSGDRVALISENRPEWVVTDQAVLFLGAVDVPLFPSQTAKQVEYILSDAGAKAIVVSNNFQLTKVLRISKNVKSLKHIIVMSPPDEMPKGILSFDEVLESGRKGHAKQPHALEEASKKVKPEDMATIIYTSGTTGNPKGVMLSHANFVSNMEGASAVLPITDEDVLLSFLPLSHVFERMAGYYTAMGCGASIAYAESIEKVADNMREISPTIVIAVPRLYERIYSRIAKMVEKDAAIKQKIFYSAIGTGRRFVESSKRGKPSVMLKLKHKLFSKLVYSKLQERTGGKIKFFVSGGAALPRELGEFFDAVGLIIIEGYGLTESSPVITVNPMGAHRYGSAGRAIPGVEMKIAADGEILTRGPHVMMGYYNNKKATEEVIDKEGWLYTGDIGTIDDQGYLFITDRKKHLFVSSGGKNIAPQPIESLFAANKYVDQFMLIGDKRMFLTALIVPDYDALREYADSHDIPYKDDADLVSNSEINKLVHQSVQATQTELANYEKVRRFSLLDKPFTIEDGEMTPSMKIRRKAVEERYGDLIESMYQS